MTKFVLYAQINGAWSAVADYEDKEGYLAAIDRYFALKRAEGKALDDCDAVLALLKQPTVVARKKFGLVKRALRHFDEIGISSELVETIDAAKEEGAEAVAWGTDDPESVEPHDFGDMVI